ncbi:MAG: sigma-70 family RNA polymerase sigma factor [Phycisphaerae bacterium]|nr:sigma-70 family RNA polymerase sigma factor [Phycisphaerae bacterium]
MVEPKPNVVKIVMPRSEEKRLIARAKRGNPEAFRELVDAYKERLFAFIWRMVRDHHEAEDISQSAFIRAYEALDSYSEKWAFSTWLFTIAYRLCVNHLRKRKALSGEMDFSRVGGPEADVRETVANTEEARRLRELIWSAVAQLSTPQKSSVLMFYREGKSCEEIGRVLAMPAVTVKSHLHRARAKLRTALNVELEDDWRELQFMTDSRYA